MYESIRSEEYFRDHATLLRAYARYTSAKASEKLFESAHFLDRQADRARQRHLDSAKRFSTKPGTSVLGY
jgi:hypothetical protein